MTEEPDLFVLGAFEESERGTGSNTESDGFEIDAEHMSQQGR